MEETEVIGQILQKGSKPEDWLQFLTQVQQHTSNHTCDNCSYLISLFKKAADYISPDNNSTCPAYAKILVDLARLQAKAKNTDEARTTFQLARNNVKGFAMVYVSWAQFELDQGNRGKCRSLLRKGRQYGATPKQMLQLAFANCVENKDQLLDKKTEEHFLTEVFTSNKIDSQGVKYNESLSPEWSQSSQSSADESTTDSQISVKGAAAAKDTTRCDRSSESTIVSFKLPSVLDGYHNPPGSQRTGSSSSSSGDDADTVPFSRAVPGKYLSMSTKKPTAKTTPNCKSGLSTLASSMSLSVQRPAKARRGLLGNSLSFGIPVRVDEEPGSEKAVYNNVEKVRGSVQQQEVPFQENHSFESGEQSVTLSCKPIHGESSKNCFEHPIETSGNVNLPLINNEPTSDKNDDQHSGISSSLHAPGKLDTEQQLILEKTKEQNRSLRSLRIAPVQQNSDSITTCEHNIPYSSCSFCIKVAQQQDHYPVPSVCQQNRLSECHNSHSGSFGIHPPHVPGVNPLEIVPPTAVMTNKTIVVNGKQYLQLETIGRGGSSRVYKCFDGKRVCAVKHVNLEDADRAVVDSYINEITLLKSLQGNENVIKLFDWELNKEASAILLVMECGSIDLAGFLRKNRQQINDNDLRTYWNQMLNTVHAIHTSGIIHSDLKPANFLFVEGKLKLIDFGIANAIQGDKTSIIRDSQVGTLNYMSPEALQDTSYGGHTSLDSSERQKPCLKIGRASDVWSLGCILYLMVYGKTPFQHITNHFMKLQCILDANYNIELPEIRSRHLMDTIKGCLRRDPHQRYTIPQLLKHPYISSGELPDEEQFFNCLMQFKSRHDVNSPRSIRALTKGLVKQLQTGSQINLSEVLPVDEASPQRLPDNVVSNSLQIRQPLMGIDVQVLQQAQSSLKSVNASNNAKYVRPARDHDKDKENADLHVILKKEIDKKYKNAIPVDTAESTFEQSWNTSSTLPQQHPCLYKPAT